MAVSKSPINKKLRKNTQKLCNFPYTDNNYIISYSNNLCNFATRVWKISNFHQKKSP